MPCDTVNLEAQQKWEMQAALKRLEAALADRSASVVVGREGSVAFRGWTDRSNWTDLCAFRRLRSSNSPALRAALARAEALAGRSADQRAIGSGLHSHDGGATWSRE